MAMANASREPDPRPGRTCPVSYRYPPRVFAREPDHVERLGHEVGLYGNVEALEAVTALAAREPNGATIAFNGDFHWFDVDAADFARVSGEVLRHPAIRGNVETELAGEDHGAGCGCAYPSDVSDADVSRSNEILERLRDTARACPEWRARLGALPMHLVARVGAARIGIVHGDATSLAGWGFAHDRLDDPRHGRWIESMFREARVDAFASSHTCLPAVRAFEWAGCRGVVANNGAAGMPNFAGELHGIVTRIALAPFTGDAVASATANGAYIDAVPLRYDAAAWMRRFAASWPPGSAAHASYARRMAEGPRFDRPVAMRAARVA
jgi:hypothetical protein